MTIGIANDHRGVKRKKEIIKFLEKKGYKVVNYGTDNCESVDYPKYAFAVGEDISSKRLDFGILLCGTGIGMSIAANKVKDVRCARIDSIQEVIARKLYNQNVETEYLEIIDERTAENIIDIPSDLRQTGIIPNYTNYAFLYGKWNEGTAQREVSEIWASKGKTSDKGIATIDDNYLVAVSPKFGKAGDEIEVVLEDGTSINCIIADVKGGDAGSEWGHCFGNSIDIIEWQSLGKQDTIELGDWRGKDVAKIINYGSYIN